MMIVADANVSLVLTGTGDVLEPEMSVAGIGSGGNYALAAARALLDGPLERRGDRAQVARYRRRHLRLHQPQRHDRAAQVPTYMPSPQQNRNRDTRDVAFRAMTAADLPLMGRWLERPHMREWWGDPDTELGYIRDMIEGRDTTRPFLFYVDDRPVGYIQYWFIGHHQNAEWITDHPWLTELPSDTIRPRSVDRKRR